MVYPAGWDEVIGVAGADIDENGEPVTSTWYLHSEAVFVSADGHYQGEKGSSYAAPRVSGLLANYLSEQKKTACAAEEAGNLSVQKENASSEDNGYSSELAGASTGDAEGLSEQARASSHLEMVRDYLKSIALDAGDTGYDTTFGWGAVGLS